MYSIVFARSVVAFLVGLQKPLLASVKRRKVALFGHVAGHETLLKTVLQGYGEKGRRRGKQKKNWLANVKEWTDHPQRDLSNIAHDRPLRQALTTESSRWVSPMTGIMWSVSG